MSGSTTRIEFDAGIHLPVNAAITGLTDFEKVHYALRLVMETNDREAVTQLRLVGSAIISGCDAVLREMGERAEPPRPIR